MQIKKLSKDELAEGLTIEMVNNLNISKNYNPVQIMKGDEPVEIVPCSKGWWVMYESGQFLKDENNQLIVYDERICRIARARYLINFGAKEKQDKAIQLVEQWKKDVRDRLDEIKNKLGQWEHGYDGSNVLMVALNQLAAQESGIDYAAENEKKYNEIAPQYKLLEELWEQNKIIELLEVLGIKKFNTLIFSAKTDNENDMRIVKNTFGGEALAKWDGDILNRYAAIEIEKQYSM